jgi:MerR family copper efflux transcriptional regulator
MQISELAAASGVPTSTLRYYERIGLVRPPGRSAAGYRLYDEDSVERVAFIGRAKRLGMTLEDVATLIDAWFAGECGPLQDRLRDFVGSRIVDIRRHIADEAAFERQLQRILIQLDHRDMRPQRCGPDCGCDVDPGVPPRVPSHGDDNAGPPALACSLSEDDLHSRRRDWRRLLLLAVRAEHIAQQWRFVFEPDAAVAVELATMCAAETACCPFFEFNLNITAPAVVLTVGGPDDLIDAFGAGLVAPEQTLAP